MKDVRINGRMARVFVLKETKDRLVYIPLNSIHRVDYDRLRDVEAIASRTNTDMLDVMSTYKLDNGRNALLQYDSIIQVMQKTADIGKISVGERLEKPGEAAIKMEVQATAKETSEVKEGYAPQTTAVPQNQPKKRGPKPKPKAPVEE